MLISDQGTLVRTRVDEVSVQGRNTQGVMLIRLSADEKLVGLERIAELEGAAEADEEIDGDSDAGGTTLDVDVAPGGDETPTDDQEV